MRLRRSLMQNNKLPSFSLPSSGGSGAFEAAAAAVPEAAPPPPAAGAVADDDELCSVLGEQPMMAAKSCCSCLRSHSHSHSLSAYALVALCALRCAAARLLRCGCAYLLYLLLLWFSVCCLRCSQFVSVASLLKR